MAKLQSSMSSLRDGPGRYREVVETYVSLGKVWGYPWSLVQMAGSDDSLPKFFCGELCAEVTVQTFTPLF